MEKAKILSGDELVARGTTKNDANLPEIGLKDVVPNGSWLEQKQIQSALEARKRLIEVERIEKCGVLSHAEWREELMLAEVTQKAGGHWQYLGHNVGKQLFLRPEEALFLIEVNSLQLKHNGVTVSLQQAYSLLLRDKISLLQYKVYASLSRLGYKVYRHEVDKLTEYEKRLNLPAFNKKVEVIEEFEVSNELDKENMETENIESVEEGDNVDVSENTENCDSLRSQACTSSNNDDSMEVIGSETDKKDKIESDAISSSISNDVTNSSKVEGSDINSENRPQNMDTMESCCANENTENDSDNITPDTHFTESKNIANTDEHINSNSESLAHQNKLNNLLNRKLKPSNTKNLKKCFEKIPDISQDNIITVSVPEEEYIPRNIFLNNVNYVLNLENIRTKTKNSRPDSTEVRPYNSNEEVNGDHVRRIRAENNPWEPLFPNHRFTGPNFQFRFNNFWRPHHNINYFPYNIFFQRPFVPLVNFLPRLRMISRPPQPVIPPRVTNIQPNSENVPNNNRKRKRDNSHQKKHLETIKHLTARLKHLERLGNAQIQNTASLQKLIQTFNTRYRTRLRLTSDFEIVNEETIVETISLDDDEATNNKKSKKENDGNYTENFNKLKDLASKLKDLESSENSNSRHRRAFSQLLKKFNKSYNTDIFMNTNFEIIDRRFITLDSSSDSDCVLEEAPKAKVGKLVKNPFSILKKLAQKQNPTVSNGIEQGTSGQEVKDNSYSEEILKVFNKDWLPNNDDFGRAEVVSKNLMKKCLINSKRDEFLFEFMKNHPHEFESWVEIKISFVRHVVESAAMEQSEVTSSTSLVNHEDCKDMPTILKKLSIIQTNKDVDSESSLAIDFDVYNRDVKNFRKSNRPKPHFGVVCINEASTLPSGKDIATLHSKYDGDMSIVFAVVGMASISYLQINPFDLPIYIPCNDLT